MKFAAWIIVFLSAAILVASEPLFSFSQAQDRDFETTGRTSFVRRSDGVEITIPAYRGGKDFRWPGINFKPQKQRYFDLGKNVVVALDVTNLSPYPIELNIQIDNDGTRGADRCAKGGVALNVGERAPLRIRLARNNFAGKNVRLTGMLETFDGVPGPHNLDLGKIPQIKLFLKEPAREVRFAVTAIRAEEEAPAPAEALGDAKTFFPCIDPFGQYRHGVWPGKTLHLSDFSESLEKENRELAAHPRQTSGRTAFGGWADGPTLKATGHFYPAKYNGYWYLVDPAGKLFWSFGIDSIYVTNNSALNERMHYFESLPDKHDSLFAGCYGRTRGVRRTYQGREVETFDFYKANLLRKYGRDFMGGFVAQTAKRLPSWGINTVANWSCDEVIKASGLPYVGQVNADGAPKIEGDDGFWYKFWEVYSPKFSEALEHGLRKRFSYAFEDPRCIGFFIDNELGWGGETGLTRSVLRSPASQPSKIAFLAQLREKYRTIEALNRVWHSRYGSWDEFAASTSLPDEKFARGDMAKFNRELVERYFRLCREAVKKVAPHKLYLGCRFAFGGHSTAVELAAKYADVISFNHYLYSVAHVGLPEGVDKPILIGEFHFGTIDRGPASPGLRSVPSQAERARALKRYVQSAMYNPQIVGVHYFKYSDQATSGRSLDDENMQIGFVDICDSPYQEMIDASREIQQELYRYRPLPAK